MNRLASVYIAVTITACATTGSDPVGLDPGESDGKADGVSAMPDVQCANTPNAGPTVPLNHSHHELVIGLGGAHHRGIDLVAASSNPTQTIAGEISYSGLLDKALEDEDVDVFACKRGAWKLIGSARTDDEGHFSLALTGDDRLRIGMRDMFVSVRADRSAARFLAIVTSEASSLAISDIDGTLTSNELAFAANAFGIDAGIHDGAPKAWRDLSARGYLVPVYVTARSRKFTQDTREWLAKTGMPRGALRLADHVLLPGSATVEYKSQTFAALAEEATLNLGVGNRASDIEAYASAGIAADHIFIKLPEFEGEVADKIRDGQAVGFPAYPGPLAGRGTVVEF